MGQRTDTRQRIVEAALDLVREKGLHGSAISDIVAASGAPRGSVTFHFPGGKDEIADEVIKLRTAQVLAGLERAAARSRTPEELVTTMVDQIADDFAGTDFALGCPIVPITLDRSAQSPPLRESGRAFYAAWREQLSDHLRAFGMAESRAGRVATLVVSAVEGALVIARLEQTRDSFVSVQEELRLLVR